MPAVSSHISCVQTPVKAAGKKSSTVFFLPRLSASFTSTRPDGFFDLSVNSGAFEPTLIAIEYFLSLRSTHIAADKKFIIREPRGVKRRLILLTKPPALRPRVPRV